SRRRHTRSYGDWSSDVCSSDLPIHDQGIIKGRFTEQEVKDKSMILRSGALPAGIKYLEERTVGPSLGTDSIRAGVRAAVYGMTRSEERRVGKEWESECGAARGD